MPAMSQPRRITVFLPNWVGDAVMATPALRALRKGFASSLWSLAERLRRKRFNLALLLPNSFRAALAARLGGVRRIAGYDRDGRGWLLTDKLQPQRLADGRFKPVPTIDYWIQPTRPRPMNCLPPPPTPPSRSS